MFAMETDRSSLLGRLGLAYFHLAARVGLVERKPAGLQCGGRLKAARLPSVVQIRDQSGRYSANVSTVAQQLCYATADGYVSGAMHHVVVGSGEEGPLNASSTYFYRVGDPLRSWSEEFSFVVPKEFYQQGGFPYRLGLVGDLGQTKQSAQTIEHIAHSRPDSVLNVGDLSYADGEQPRWDSYGRLVEKIAAVIPHMTIEGNHELESMDGGPKDFTAYLARWQMPYSRSGSTSPLYYSYETGPAHIIMLGSYAEYGPQSEQVAWLRADLAAVDRVRTPWLVVGMHAPWYNSNIAHQQEMEDMRTSMEAMLFSYGVDVVFSGHVHAYERSARMFNYRRNKCGPVHIVIGDGGNREGLAMDYLKQPHWSMLRESSYGHGTLDFDSVESATWRWHRNQDGLKITADKHVFRRDSRCSGK